MANVTSTLTIAGSTVDRDSARVTLQRLCFGIAGVETLDFTQEVTQSLQGSYSEGSNVTLSLTDGTTTHAVFRGQIVGHTTSGIGTGVISVGYHCLGARWAANQVMTTGADGTGRIVYDLPHTDDNWSPNLSGLSVGSILADYFAQHSSQLTALGVSQPPAGDLTPLTVVPTDPVVLTGRIFDMADALLSSWGYSKYQLYIDPDSNQIRIKDTTTLPATTLTLGTDPIQVPSFSVDTSECYTQMVLRGAGQISAAILSLGTGTLVGEATSGGGWTSTQQAAWTWTSFAYPSNSVIGTITSMTTTTVTADAFSGPVTTWATNYWNQAQIWVQFGFAGGGGAFETTETAEVIAVTATSGGSATFTADVPFQSTFYTSIEVRGAPTGEALVWRKYTIPDTVQRPSDGSPLNLHLAQQLMGSYPWSPTDGIVVQATGPTAEIYHGGQSFFATFQIYPSPDGIQAGYIVFDKPTVSVYSTMSSMLAGTPDAIPSDVKILIPYSNGALTAQAPGSGYQGTAYSTYGIQRTWYKDYFNWVAKGQSSNMTTLAQNFLDTVKDAVISGTCIYHGVPIGLMGLGKSLNVTGGLATGSQLAAMNCPIRQVTVEWPDYGGTYQVTQLVFDNRRKPYSGESLFIHPIAQRAPSRPDDFAFGAAGARFAGFTGHPGAEAYQGEAPEMEFGPDGPGRRKERTRYGSAEAHDAADRRRRELAEARAQEAEEQKHAGAEDIAHLDRTRSRRLRAAVVPHSEESQRLAGREATGREEKGRLIARKDKGRTDRLARTMRPSDNAIVAAHQGAYGEHDPSQAIVDAHRRGRGDDGGGEEVASND